MKSTRVARVVANMEQLGLHQLIISDPDSIYYLTGIGYDPGERLLALYLNNRGEATLFNNQMFPQQEQEGLRICNYDDVDDNIGMLADTVSSGAIGVDKFWRAKFLLPLLERRADLRPRLGSPAVDNARKLKDAEEIELMRRSSALNDATMAEMVTHLGDGLTEREMASLVGRTHVKLGGDCEVGQLVCFGANGSEPHHVSDGTSLNEGEGVVFDIYVPVQHYCCDMTRTVFWKRAGEEERRVYEIVRQANLAGIAAVRPGIPLSEVDRAARQVIEQAGYGQYFTHRTGHGIGLALHEPPDCSSICHELIQPGMVFSVEPGIYLPGKFGVRVEDLVAVNEDGCEVLNNFTKDLLIVD